MDVNWGGSCVFRKINFIILGYSTLYTCYFQLQFLSWPSASKVGKVLFFISFLVHVFSTAEKRLPPNDGAMLEWWQHIHEEVRCGFYRVHGHFFKVEFYIQQTRDKPFETERSFAFLCRVQSPSSQSGGRRLHRLWCIDASRFLVLVPLAHHWWNWLWFVAE